MTTHRAAVALGLAVATGLSAPGAAAAAPAMPREVIAIYTSTEKTALRGQSLPTAVETVLNHLGLVVRYHDAAEGLPDAALTARARGVVTLVSGSRMPHAAAYARYLADRLKAGQRVVILGGVGFLEDAATHVPTPHAAWQPVFAGLGMAYDGAFLGDPARVAVADRGPATRFERPWTDPLAGYVQAASTDPRNEVFLRLKRLDSGATSDMGVVGPAGAVLLENGHLAWTNPFTYRLQWRVDPFWLFEKAFGTAGAPRPDATTVNGRRVFYAHIDGDGFANVANRRGRPLAAEVVRDEVLAQTPLPTTVSVIAGELAGKARLEAIARTIFALPTVEPASHSYTHPFDWDPGTPSDADEAPSASAHYAGAARLDPRHEIDDSFRYIDTLLPAGKRTAMMLWSGETNPTAPFLARTEALGVPNMNGGDAMIDPHRPSYTQLSPLSRWVGPHLQVYASAANENLFTNLWTGPFDGHREAVHTFRFAGAPRRMAPVNIYYHFYEGEREAGVKALKTLYGWAETQPLAPVFASRYARMVSGWHAMAIAPDGPGAWRVTNAGACRTLRFDAEPRTPDLTASRGVAGYHRANGDMYVHLAEADARVALAESPTARPRLEEASAPLTAWRATDRSIHAAFEADGPFVAVLAGLPPGGALRLGGTLAGPRAADAQGRLTLAGPRGAHRLEVAW
ncbi:MAG: hypothetical protein ACK46X_15070 [Candidatus Sericytochromatia bacterium]